MSELPEPDCELGGPEPERMIDTERAYCDECAAIQRADPMRHFKGCSHRVESESHSGPRNYRGHGVYTLTETQIPEMQILLSENGVLREELRKALNREKLLSDNLTSTQERCTQLTNEARR